MIDHAGVAVNNFGASKAFYASALAPLGYALLLEVSDAAGFGVPPKPDFWIGAGTSNVSPVHVAFRVTSRSLVDAFYKAAIAAGGRDNGAPVYVRTTIQTTMARLYLIRVVTTSKPSAMSRSDG